MKKIVFFVINLLQIILVKISFRVCSIFPLQKKDGWVVVAKETASMLKNISSVLPESISVNFTPNRFYDFSYDYEVYSRNKLLKVFSLLYSPLLLGYLMNKYDKFLYLGAIGFLRLYIDGRKTEFELLKNKNKKLVCYFLGSEIRSFELLNEFAKNKSLDVITRYQGISNIGIDSIQNEYKRKQLGQVADRYADFIFNPSTDQMAYIERETYPILYFIPAELFFSNTSKFDDLKKIIIVHGPSSPILKGTQIVRAAIKKLQVEGYNFQYIELINVPHEQMLKALKSAHIVLNEFYAFVPGVFGLEAMANSCALLTSADRTIESTLDEGANDAWKVTPYWTVYDNLKLFLDNPGMIKPQAIKGYSWAKKHCTSDASLGKWNDIVND